MTESHFEKVARELGIKPIQAKAVSILMAEGATVPFIARYRKEVTGSLDEVQITNVRDRLTQLVELDTRRESILKSLTERNLLTDALKTSLSGAQTLSEIEDIYQPFKPRKRTRAQMAREKGLEPLAETLFKNQESVHPLKVAEEFISPEKEVANAEEALAGARDIIAEWINDDKTAREQVRALYFAQGEISSKLVAGKEEAGAKFKDYFDWTEPFSKIPSHRLLAIRRGEAEGFLYYRIQPPEPEAIGILEKLFVKGRGPGAQQVQMAAQDCYRRMLSLSMETEARIEAKKRADTEAIRVFAENLRELLLAAPLGQKTVLAIDPGFRTGCKVTILDRQGKLLHNDVVYPDRGGDAALKVRGFCQHFKVEAIAIGNGTAGRETETFVKSLKLPASITVVMVNESGASIYSASEVAREEFPDHDLTVRGSVSIGRRLQDPLAELVKIDPKSIGVGQYQHDVEQGALKKSLDDTVISCVNSVGVELNSASKELLSYVSGLNAQIAGNVVAHRNQKGAFKSRDELREVPRLGPKAFEQAAGFLRIRAAGNPLDASAVHPESYHVVERMARDLGCAVGDLMAREDLRKKIDLQKYVDDKVGLPTLRDILGELSKPGRDPRQQFEAFSFAEGVNDMKDLKPGMKLPGIVTNVTAFGAFVDIGVHQDGLVHISQMSDQFVKNPADVLKVAQRVEATVMEVDLPRKRIALSLKKNPVIGENRSTGGTSRPMASAAPRDRSPSGRSGGGGFNNPFSNL
ncbi:MAG: Tex family protein [Verrucomicrobiae bacterium]|nr:Tex family protein [Verrucomicrobiae bacterium]